MRRDEQIKTCFALSFPPLALPLQAEELTNVIQERKSNFVEKSLTGNLPTTKTMRFIVAITNRDEKKLATTLRLLTEAFSFQRTELLRTPDSLAQLKQSVWAKYRSKTVSFMDITAATEEEIELYVSEMANHSCDVGVLAYSDSNLTRSTLSLSAEKSEYLVLQGLSLQSVNTVKTFSEITVLRDDFALLLQQVFAASLKEFIDLLCTDYCNREASAIVKAIKNPLLA